jgi:dimethylaniline monooxygenase (N-oxide forming)
MSTYLEEYVDSHSYAGKTLRERVIFSATVKSLEKIAGLWTIKYSSALEGDSTLLARRVIVSTGSTSIPNMPSLKGSAAFKGPIIHTLDFGRSNILEDASLKQITILGGGKSAADMVYQSVKAGKQVSWVIRNSGKGPGGFVAGKSPGGPYRNVPELGITRIFSAIVIPSGLGKNSWLSTFLFRTKLGRWMHEFLERAANKQTIQAARYNDRPGAKESFKNLKSEMNAFFLTSPAGIVHYADFWDTIAQNVDIYREDIDHIDENNIYLTSGASINSDAILCGTGFNESFPFLTPVQCIDLGLPHSISDEPPEITKEWTTLTQTADAKILKRFPRLANPPPLPENLGDISTSIAPYRLYNCIIPLSVTQDRSIAFTGFANIPNMFACSEINAIYATAYLDGHLKLPPMKEMKEHIAYTSSYMRLRCPTYGLKGNFWNFDLFPYVDGLLGEMGLSSYRHKGWWANWTSTFLIEDLRGLKDEYLKKYGKEFAE